MFQMKRHIDAFVQSQTLYVLQQVGQWQWFMGGGSPEMEEIMITCAHYFEEKKKITKYLAWI